MDGLLDRLNRAQRAAAEATRGPVCILAGAGSGKTRTITHRIAHQIVTGVARPDQVLAVTFTDRAASELRGRLTRLGVGGPIRAATFHSAAWAQLRWFWPRTSDQPLPDVLSSKVGLLVPAARRLGVEAKDLAAEIEWAKARRLDPPRYAGAAATRVGPLPAGQMAAVFADYEQRKAERGLIDFDDMLLWMTRLLSDDSAVAAEVRDRYRYLTVDEFQDVNPAQYALLRAWLGDSRELCVVGDDDQTIYSFAGASSAYLTGFTRDFPGAHVVTLTDNYRSCAPVIALANRVLWTKPARLRKRLVSRVGPGPPPAFDEHADADAEVAAVLTRVRELLAQGVPADEIAIAYRVNSQSEPFEAALSQAGIPFAVRGDTGFWGRPEIVQALTLLRAAAQRRDSPADPGAVPAPARADRRVEQALRDGLSWHPRREPSGAAARERWRNLAALSSLAAQLHAGAGELDFAGLVAELSARATRDDASPGGGVNLLTLHKAKGSEFDAVLLVGLEEGLMPISYARTDAEVEEERRLLYVGVTRARRHLWLSWARARPGFRGRVGARRPSRFLYNLGPGAPVAAAPAPQRIPMPAASAAPVAALQGADAALAERLRAWRRERAQADGKPAFVVFSDRTLADLARRRPQRETELLGVHGLGPAKVARYGADLLGVLRQEAS